MIELAALQKKVGILHAHIDIAVRTAAQLL